MLARHSSLVGRSLGRRQHEIRQPRQIGQVLDDVQEGVGRIEQIVTESRTDLVEFLPHRLEPGALGGRQLDTAEAEIAQFVVDQTLLTGQSLGLRRVLTKRGIKGYVKTTSGQSVKVAKANLLVGNAVVHIVGEVLLPKLS